MSLLLLFLVQAISCCIVCYFLVTTVIFLTIIDVIIFDTERFCLLMSFPFELRIFFVKAAKNALDLLIFFFPLFSDVFFICLWI